VVRVSFHPPAEEKRRRRCLGYAQTASPSGGERSTNIMATQGLRA
jgi:hypothetical protein